MKSNVTIISVVIALIIGFGAGFALRPVLAPTPSPATLAGAAPAAVTSRDPPRSLQYFAAHIDEARRVVAGCRTGSVRGGECGNADQAVIEADGRKKFDTFFKH